MTRGLRWRETALGVLTMGLIMVTAVAVGDASDNLVYAIELVGRTRRARTRRIG